MGYAKIRVLKKKRWTSVQSSQLKERERERKRDNPWSSLVLQSSSTIYKREVCLQGAKVELGFHHHYHCPHLPHSPPYSAIPYINHTCTSWFDCMTCFFGSIVWLYNICFASMYTLSSTYELHISNSYRVRESIEWYCLREFQKYHILFKKREGITLLLSWWGSINTTYWETWGSHTKETLSFISKAYKNSKIIVEQRAWDIALELTVLSFNCSRPKRRLQAPWLKIIWVSMKVRIIIIWRRILVWKHEYFLGVKALQQLLIHL